MVSKINCEIEDDLMNRFKGMAALDGKSMKEVLDKIITDWVEKEERKRLKK